MNKITPNTPIKLSPSHTSALSVERSELSVPSLSSTHPLSVCSVCSVVPSLLPLLPLLFVYFVSFVVAPFSSLAQSAPPLISYQGRIADTNGVPLPTADYTLTATLWSAPTGGSNLWAEIHPSTPVVQGFFSLVLGGLSNGLDMALSSTNVHIEVQAALGAGQTATTLRQRLLSMPYAVRSGYAERSGISSSVQGDTLHVVSSNGYVCVGGTNATAMLDVRTSVSMFGPSTSRQYDTVYVAESDGFVTAWGSDTGIRVLTGTSNPPTTTRSYAVSADYATSVTVPVAKGEYWMVRKEAGHNAPDVRWMRLGR